MTEHTQISNASLNRPNINSHKTSKVKQLGRQPTQHLPHIHTSARYPSHARQQNTVQFPTDTLSTTIKDVFKNNSAISLCSRYRLQQIRSEYDPVSLGKQFPDVSTECSAVTFRVFLDWLTLNTRYNPSKRRELTARQSLISHKTTHFSKTAVRTSNLAGMSVVWQEPHLIHLTQTDCGRANTQFHRHTIRNAINTGVFTPTKSLFDIGYKNWTTPFEYHLQLNKTGASTWGKYVTTYHLYYRQRVKGQYANI